MNRRQFLIRGATGLAAIAVAAKTLDALSPAGRAELVAQMRNDGYVADQTFILEEPLPIEFAGLNGLTIKRCNFLWRQRTKLFFNFGDESIEHGVVSECVFTTVDAWRDSADEFHKTVRHVRQLVERDRLAGRPRRKVDGLLIEYNVFDQRALDWDWENVYHIHNFGTDFPARLLNS